MVAFFYSVRVCVCVSACTEYKIDLLSLSQYTDTSFVYNGNFFFFLKN